MSNIKGEYIVPVYTWSDDQTAIDKGYTELIRCKDCKHYDKFINQNIGQGWCDVAAWRGRYMGYNDYCSRAERRGEDAKRKS